MLTYLFFPESFTRVHFVSFERFENGFNTCCRPRERIFSCNGSGSCSLFCNPNHEINQLSQEEKEYNQRRKINFLLMEKQEIINVRLSKLMCSDVAIGNPERHVHKASHRGSKQQ